LDTVASLAKRIFSYSDKDGSKHPKCTPSETKQKNGEINKSPVTPIASVLVFQKARSLRSLTM